MIRLLESSNSGVIAKIATRMCEEFFNRDTEYYCTVDTRDGELSEGGVIDRKNWVSYHLPYYRSVRAAEVLVLAGVDEEDSTPNGWLFSHDGKPARHDLRKKMLAGLAACSKKYAEG